MGVYSRTDSRYWWFWLETAAPGHQRERSDLLVGTTVQERTDSKRLALAAYAERMRALGASRHRLPVERPQIRFSVYASTYRRDTLPTHKGADREGEILTTLDRYFGAELLSLIDPARVKSYRTWRRPTASDRTINREIDLLKAMCRDAVPTYLEANPLAGMPRFKAVPPRRRLMTATEERKLLAVAKADAQDHALLVLGLDTLVRLGDLLDLQWRDREGDWLYIADPKGGEPYEVPLSHRAARVLDRLRKAQFAGEHLFPKFRRAMKPRDWRGSVRQRLEYLCREAVLPYGRVEHGLTWHWATRRTGATRLLIAKRQPVAVVQKLGNWKTPDVLLAVYTEAERSDLLKAVGRKAGRALPVHSRKVRKRA